MSKSPETTFDPFPNLDEAFARRVQAGLDKHFGNEAPRIAWEHWLKLKPYLAAYKREVEDHRGFLNKGEAQILLDVSKRAAALLAALERACDAGLKVPVSAALEPMTLSDLEDLLRKIEGEFALEGKIAPDIVDMTRADLFSNFEAWWERATDLPATIKEGWSGNSHPTPFMFVANEVFNLPGMPPPTGASYKSLKDFRRADRKRFEKFERLAEALKKRGLLE